MLMIFKNSDGTEFRLGEENQEFDSCNNSDLCSSIHNSEQYITEKQQMFGAKTEYYDFRKDKYCTAQEYEAHFINYDSDESYILPTSTFEDIIQVECCLKFFNQVIEDTLRTLQEN